MVTDPSAARDTLEIAELGVIQSGILDWFDLHRRALPWRETRDPYQILVSEVMLQQTQVGRVIPYYERFLERFPTVADLAGAPTSDVITLWGGLGYNKRAVNLQRTAVAVVENFDGHFPDTVEGLQTLPGIGPYTAGAIACFAFEQDVAFLDTNMRRVLGRVVFGEAPSTSGAGARSVRELAERFVPADNGWTWNQALIEFGALQCTSRKPACVVCPLQTCCRAFPVAQQQTGKRPQKSVERFEDTNRYFRGQVIKFLREQPSGAGLTFEELGPEVRDGYTADSAPWLESVVEGLEKDGLVAIHEEQPPYDAPLVRRVSLP